MPDTTCPRDRCDEVLDRHDERLERQDARLSEHDRRLLALETSAKVAEGEIVKLAASSHEKANWLNRHNLEIAELQMKAQHAAIVAGRVDGLEGNLAKLHLELVSQLAQLRSDLRQNTWAVSVIVGIIVVVGRALADKFL